MLLSTNRLIQSTVRSGSKVGLGVPDISVEPDATRFRASKMVAIRALFEYGEVSGAAKNPITPIALIHIVAKMVKMCRDATCSSRDSMPMNTRGMIKMAPKYT